jgi:hypothetical protein
MQNFGIQVLLNDQILGPGAGVPQERRFARIQAANIQPPDYDPKYFETLPTAWAVAYTFQRAIEKGNPAAVEEWVSLMLLCENKALHLKPHRREMIQAEYDRDLWPALSGTYPSPRQDSLEEIRLIQTDGGVVVGAFYPGILLFPSRGRAGWRKDENLEPYLDGDRLSWAVCRELLLPSESERGRFLLTLKSIAASLEQESRRALQSFYEQEPAFRNIRVDGPLESLGEIIKRWGESGPGGQFDPLEAYPFKQPRSEGVTYYLVAGLPVVADWMRNPIRPGLPAPNQYERVSDTQIRVRFGGRQSVYDLGPQDRIVLLKELFLEKDPYWCALSRDAAEMQAGQIRRLHRQEITNTSGEFAKLKQNDVAMCLAPARSRLFEHFPDLRGRTETGGLEWEFTLFNQKIVWPTEPKYSKALPDSALELWPPKVAAQWNLYVAHGRGAHKDSCGRWSLVDETGRTGENVELSADEYVNILSDPGRPNRPKALCLRDSTDNERGVLFLAKLDEQASAGVPASLAMDFGTSNSCLAYKTEGSAPQPLTFDEKLSPRMLWGLPPNFENPGFVPFKWGGRKGYFPTLLLSRLAANTAEVRADNLEAKHLFWFDIPGLHRGMQDSVFTGSLSNTWGIRKNLKWQGDRKKAWERPLFLGLALLYAHAELFFNRQARVGNYTFTFPLAFTDFERDGFHDEAKQVISRIRHLCYGDASASFGYVDSMNESAAIANSVNAVPNKSVVEVFVDIGGGTTDLAIRHDGRFLVLDSIKIAGRSFFTAAEENFRNGSVVVEGNAKFREHLSKLITESGTTEELNQSLTAVRAQNLDLGTCYSLAINRLDDQAFREREGLILQQGMGWPSYQLFRSELFFRHILAYALVQACAVVTDKKLDARILTSGIKLILSGNGWGLMLFGEFRRSREKVRDECRQMLDLLRAELLKHYADENLSEEMQRERDSLMNLRVFDVDLLNERTLSKAKTDVPVGALTNIVGRREAGNGDESTQPYAGVTLRGMRLNGSDQFSVRWCDRWGIDDIRRKHGFHRMRGERVDSLEIGPPESYERPLDHALAVFTSLGGSGDRDPMPPEEWQKMNSLLCDHGAYIDPESHKLTHAPINYFVSRILYPEDAEHMFLNRLAEINKTLK